MNYLSDTLLEARWVADRLHDLEPDPRKCPVSEYHRACALFADCREVMDQLFWIRGQC